MTCRHCQAAEIQFGKCAAKKDLTRYQRKGPDKTTLQVLEAVRGSDLTGVSLLDVGGGVGVIHHELLGDVAESAVHVEAVQAYLDQAEEESKSRGHDSRVEFVHGDFVDLELEIPKCDIVTLDRVICCYPYLEPLVAASLRKAAWLWAASYPLDRWYIRAFVFLGNLGRRLTGNEFRSYVHSTREFDELVRAAGFAQCFKRTGLIWETAAYSR